jgi:hypothetical protein
MSKSIAQIILEQLGGRKFLAMTGAKNLLNTGKGLSMHLPRNAGKAKYLTITLNSMDTYDMKFQREKRTLDKALTAAAKAAGMSNKFYNTEIVVVKEYKGVYSDMLQDLFTEVTGMYTTL